MIVSIVALLAVAAEKPQADLIFVAGKACTKYVGTSWFFNVPLKKGQAYIATSTGEGEFGSGHANWTTTDRRALDISGPANIELDDRGQFVAPAAGVYSFSITGRFLWGTEGEFIICKIPKIDP